MAQYNEYTLMLPDGIEVLYTDSGALNTANYTTTVVLHGNGFNGHGFVRLYDYAHKHNLRTVICNRRDYPGSTKYSNEELADVREGRQMFLDRLALQTAWFLKHFIEQENTARVTGDRTARGFILMGWSYNFPRDVADPAVIPQPLYKTVEPYLRSLVVYNPPILALGYSHPMPEGVYDPLSDPK
ncbi:hypothetical protein B0H17DRAFT_1251945 [Mycena rosella]|uniref:AB hydrolase-1 domain-containing protein n=1 Tax=Mycena rosella TaxID=1033263 RepID=A0AAD7CWW4_MYCRO|nr:hypothetical protein B0H17DRAFT_1251945 [Mycena rosella]